MPDKDFYELEALIQRAFDNPNDMVRLIYNLLMGFCPWADEYPDHEQQFDSAAASLEEVLVAIEEGKYE